MARLGLALLALSLAIPASAAKPIPTKPIVAGKCVAVDGDTLSCFAKGARVSIRLNGIDAPELPGHCRAGRNCAPGDPFAAKAALSSWVKGRTTRWVSFGTDHYGRTIAAPRASRRDLSCSLLRGGFAIYKRRWDNFAATRTACPKVAK